MHDLPAATLDVVPGAPTLPREIAPGTFWMSGCSRQRVGEEILHSHSSFYLVCGAEKTAIVDAGNSRDWVQVRKQLLKALDGRRLDYIVPTHPEVPHMGNLEPLLEMFPECQVVGDVRNYHLFFPDWVANLRQMRAGQAIELGGRRLDLVEAVIHDLPNSLWVYDSTQQILFACDAYCYVHEHEPGQCAMFSEELPHAPTVADTSFVIERALAFTRFVDPEPMCRALDAFLATHPVRMVAPTHGGVISDPAAMTQVFKAGLRRIRGHR